MTQIFINNVVVDITQEMVMSLNYAIADIIQPDKRNTNFSKTLKLPGTKTNNKLFGHIFEINKEILSTDSLVNFTPDFNPNLKSDCKIFQENLLQFSGVVQLIQINRNLESYEYEVCVFGTLRNLMLNIEGRKLEDLDFTEYNHTFSRARMKESWDTKIQKNGADYVNFASGNPTGEGYVYPTIDYGYTQSPTKLNVKNSYPAIYVREYLVKIFEYAGFTWTSELFDSNFFKRLIIPFNKAKALLTDQEKLNRSFRASTTVDYTGTGALPNVPIMFDDEVSGINFDTTNQYIVGGPPSVITFYSPTSPTSPGTFTVKKKGTYDVCASINFTADFESATTALPVQGFGRIKISIIKKDGNTLVESTVATTNNYDFRAVSGGGTFDIKASNIKVDKGDWFFVRLYFDFTAITPNDPTPVANFNLHSGSAFYANAVTLPLTLNDLMYVNSAVPKEVLQKDFFTSIIRMFNLYVQPDPNNDANLLIEPLVDFYQDNELLDWSDKVDYSQDILIKPCSAIEGKNYIFRYKPDNDFYNSDYRKNYEKEYGERNIAIANDFVKGTKIIDLVFSPTPSYGILTNEMVIPRIVTINEENGSVKPYDSNIRILYYGGVLDAGGKWKWVDSTTHTETTYAYAGHLDHPFTPSLDLLFAVPDSLYWGAPSNIGSNYTTNNLFNKYWLQFIDEITDPNSKIVTLAVRLRPIDVFKLNFKNFIHVDGVNYRLNKILDYNPASEGTCKAELSKVKRGYTFVPGIADGDGITNQDPTLFDIVEGSKDEVRSASAYSIVQLIDGSKDSVINLSSSVAINILNGGKN